MISFQNTLKFAQSQTATFAKILLNALLFSSLLFSTEKKLFVRTECETTVLRTGHISIREVFCIPIYTDLTSRELKKYVWLILSSLKRLIITQTIYHDCEDFGGKRLKTSIERTQIIYIHNADHPSTDILHTFCRPP